MPDRRPFEQLPDNVQPINYGLCLKPNLIDFTFEGKLEAPIEVKNAPNQIVMNCADIDIITASYAPDRDEEYHATGFNYENEDENILQTGHGLLKIDFVGELSDKMKSFYHSKYTTASGEVQYAAVTQFEDTGARRAFPCSSDPSIKATFDVTLVVPKDRVALSNMNIIAMNPYPDDESLVEVKFARTPVMSTYLVVFVVGEHDFGNTFSRWDFNPCIDFITIADFAARAMENWALVTYWETALLFDPKDSCSSSCQWGALVVGHELAHQWFGNLFVFVDYTHAQELDALDNSHPIEVNVRHPSEVDEIFDAISHSKESFMIRMLHNYISDKDFLKVMNQYLTKFQENNASTEDLWESLEQASGKPIAAVMSTWTKQMAFPLIYVDSEQNEDFRVLKLPHLGEDCPQCMVPINICTCKSLSSSKHTILMDKPETTMVLEGMRPDHWVKINPGTVGEPVTWHKMPLLAACG
ncbi:puromycin-sensitive aminopeptidase isoform X1 [Pelobates cultripes]|uniref:Puromycin-sensitive aminopeptidase isoform X1 n=1 Tax=Pelobates cultripes TaxID=61616 RepID=A0AAD1TK62_PELCU|nr:puromycin-sensitive aminopeptidase isoform X1 [Pelobates cultripes]